MEDRGHRASIAERTSGSAVAALPSMRQRRASVVVVCRVVASAGCCCSVGAVSAQGHLCGTSNISSSLRAPPLAGAARLETLCCVARVGFGERKLARGRRVCCARKKTQYFGVLWPPSSQQRCAPLATSSTPQRERCTAARPPLEASVTRQLQAMKSVHLATRTRRLLRPSASFLHLLPDRVQTTS